MMSPVLPDPDDYEFVVPVNRRRLLAIVTVIAVLSVTVLAAAALAIIATFSVGAGAEAVPSIALLVLCALIVLALAGYALAQHVWLVRRGWVIAANSEAVVMLGEFGYIRAPWHLVDAIRLGRLYPLTIELSSRSVESGSGLETDKRAASIRTFVKHGVRIGRGAASLPAEDVRARLERLRSGSTAA